MTETPAPPDGYTVPCRCVLPAFTVGQAVVDPFRVEQCPTCGTTWTSRWRRDPGGETQPWWDLTALPPDDWTLIEPPASDPEATTT